MSHGGFLPIIGDIVGAVAGFFVGGPFGAAAGAALGGGLGEAASGGKLGQDFLAAGEGAALGFGGGELAAGAGLAGGSLLGGATDAADAGAGGLVGGTFDSTAAAAAGGVTDASSGLAAASGVSGGLGSATDAASGLALGNAGAAPGISAGAVSGLGSAATGAAPADLTSALGAVPSGSELSAADQGLLSAQGSLASGGTNAVGLSTSSDLASSAGSGLAGGAGGLPTPPIPPALDAAGNPVAGFGVSGAGGSATDAASGLGVSQGATPSVATAGTDAGTWDTGPYGAANPTGASGGLGNSVNNALGSVGSYIGNHPIQALGVGVAGLGILKDLSAQNSIPGMSQLTALAQQSATQGQVLQNYLTTGTLPPAIQASVQAATSDGIQAIRAKYASMGIAPNSSAEVQDIARLNQNAVIQGATLADQLLQQGISETQLSGTLYNELVGANTQLNNQTGSAITNLASALAGGGVRVSTGSGNTGNTVSIGG